MRTADLLRLTGTAGALALAIAAAPVGAAGDAMQDAAKDHGRAHGQDHGQDHGGAQDGAQDGAHSDAAAPGEPALTPALTPVKAKALTPVEAKARDYFTDTTLVDHKGVERQFFSDLLRDKTVAVSFFFTECDGACPIINNMLSVAQDDLGDRLGQDIFFVSLSVDPETDTADKLAEYRAQYDAKEGWTFVTGEPAAVETVNRKLGHVADREAHLTTLMVGNPSDGRWRKLAPNAGPEAIATTLRDFADGVYDEPK